MTKRPEVLTVLTIDCYFYIGKTTSGVSYAKAIDYAIRILCRDFIFS